MYDILTCHQHCSRKWDGVQFSPLQKQWVTASVTNRNKYDMTIKCAEIVDDVGGRSTILNVSNGTGRERGYNFLIPKHNEWWKCDLLIQVRLYYINIHPNSIVLKVHFSPILKIEMCLLLSLGQYLWLVGNEGGRGHHPPSSHCFGTDMGLLCLCLKFRQHIRAKVILPLA